MTRFNATFSSDVLCRFSLSSGTDSENPSFSRQQLLMDASTQNFSHEAGNWQSLAAMLAGGIFYRAGKTLTFAGFSQSASNHLLARFAPRVLAPVFGLGMEVAAFEGTNRSLSVLRGGTRENPNLLSWSGRGGIAEGLRDSLVTFGVMKSVGHLTHSHNLFMQHFSQDLSLVLGHEATARLGWTPAEEGDWLQRLVNAEAVNFSIGMGMLLAHRLTGGRLQSVEQNLSRQVEARASMARENVSPRGFLEKLPSMGMVEEASRSLEVRDTAEAPRVIERLMDHPELRAVSEAVRREVRDYLNHVGIHAWRESAREGGTYASVVSNRFAMVHGLLEHLGTTRRMVQDGQLERRVFSDLWHMVLGVMAKDSIASAITRDNHPIQPFYLEMMGDVLRRGPEALQMSLQTLRAVLLGLQNYREALREADVFPPTSSEEKAVEPVEEANVVSDPGEEVEVPRPMEQLNLRIQAIHIQVEFYGEGFVPEAQKRDIRSALQVLLERGEVDANAIGGASLEDGSALIEVLADDVNLIRRRFSNPTTRARLVLNMQGVLQGILIQTPEMRDYRLGEIPEAVRIVRKSTTPSVPAPRTPVPEEAPATPVLEEAAASFSPDSPEVRDLSLEKGRGSEVEAVAIEAPAETAGDRREEGEGSGSENREPSEQVTVEVPKVAQEVAPEISLSGAYTPPSRPSAADYARLGRGAILGIDPRAQSFAQAQVQYRGTSEESRTEGTERTRSGRFEELAEDLEMLGMLESLNESMKELETREEKGARLLEYLQDLMTTWQQEGLVIDEYTNRVTGVYRGAQRRVLLHLDRLRAIIRENLLSSYVTNPLDPPPDQLNLSDWLTQSIAEVRNPRGERGYEERFRGRRDPRRPSGDQTRAPVEGSETTPPPVPIPETPVEPIREVFEEVVPVEVDLAVPVEREAPSELAERMRSDELVLERNHLLEEFDQGLELLEHAESQGDLSPDQIHILASFRRVQRISTELRSLEAMRRVAERMRDLIAALRTVGEPPVERPETALAPAESIEAAFSPEIAREEAASEALILRAEEAVPLEAPAIVMIPVTELPVRAPRLEVPVPVERILVSSPTRLLTKILPTSSERVTFLESYLRGTTHYRLSQPAPTFEELRLVDRVLLEYDASQPSPDPVVAEYRGVIARLLRGPDALERENFVREALSTSSAAHAFYESLSEQAKLGLYHALLRLASRYRVNISEFLQSYQVQYRETKENFASAVLSTMASLADREVRGFKRLFMPTARDGKLLSSEARRLFSSLAELEAALDATTLEDYALLQMDFYEVIPDWQGLESLRPAERAIFEAMQARGYPVEKQMKENTAGVSMDMLCGTQNGSRVYIEVKSNDVAMNPDAEQMAKMAVQAFRIAHLLRPGDRLEYHFRTRRGIGIQPALLASMAAILESTGVPYVIRIMENGNPERVQANLRNDEAPPRMPRLSWREAVLFEPTHILPFPPYERSGSRHGTGGSTPPEAKPMETAHPESGGVVMMVEAPVVVPELPRVREAERPSDPEVIIVEESLPAEEMVQTAETPAARPSEPPRDRTNRNDTLLIDGMNELLKDPERVVQPISFSRRGSKEELITEIRRHVRRPHLSVFLRNLIEILKTRSNLKGRVEKILEDINVKGAGNFISVHQARGLVEIVEILKDLQAASSFQDIVADFRMRTASAGPELVRDNILEFIRKRAADLLALQELQSGYESQDLGNELASLAPDCSKPLNPDMLGDWALSILQLRGILAEHMSMWNAWSNANSVLAQLDWVISVHQLFTTQVQGGKKLSLSQELEEQRRRLFP